MLFGFFKKVENFLFFREIKWARNFLFIYYVEEREIRIVKKSTFENQFSTELHLKTTFRFE